jgi:NAD(P)-dependent dehydrogenase (short-subunit alcohol dehydrogenase family)
MALALADAGAEVAVASRSQGELGAVAAEIKQRGSRGHAVIIDVMSREQITAGVDEAAHKLGGLDILINNAGGVIAENPVQLDPLNHDPRAFEDNLFLNLTQAFYATHAALPYMIKQKWAASSASVPVMRKTAAARWLIRPRSTASSVSRARWPMPPPRTASM